MALSATSSAAEVCPCRAFGQGFCLRHEGIDRRTIIRKNCFAEA